MIPDVSIVIPAFEEEERLGSSLTRIVEYLTADGSAFEVIVVDDGSRDRTADVAREVLEKYADLDSEVIRYEQNRGKGFAVKTGLQAARAPVALFSDADLSTPIEEMAKLVGPIREGEFDVTLGSRALDRSLIGTHQPWPPGARRKGFQLGGQDAYRHAFLGYAMRLQGIQNG